MIDGLKDHYQDLHVDVVLGIEARGFIFAPALAYALGAGFVPVRKPKKLPAEIVSVTYDLEYGTDSLEMHRDAVAPGTRVLIVDDLLATGGTAAAAARMVREAGGDGRGHRLRGRADLPQRARQAGRERRLLAAAIRQMSADPPGAPARVGQDSISICACSASGPTATTNCAPFSRPSRWPTRIEIAFTPGRKTAVELDDDLAIPDNLVIARGAPRSRRHAHQRPRRDASHQAHTHGRRTGRRIVGRSGRVAGAAGAGRARARS